MHLSRLDIDVGNDPTRERPGRLWLRNLYRVHQRLCMAFPSEPCKVADPDFLKPFSPDEFGKGQVHVRRADESGFLFRIDPKPGGGIVILVQSAVKARLGVRFSQCRLPSDRSPGSQAIQSLVQAEPAGSLPPRSQSHRERFVILASV